MHEIGDVCLVRIYYKGTEGQSKLRPVLIFNADEESNLVSIVEITSIPPKNPPTFYDRFKEQIMDWNTCGLNQSSYVKCKNIHRIDRSRLIQKIGTIEEDDFIRIIEKIVEYNV